jgi:hypothetical protein
VDKHEKTDERTERDEKKKKRRVEGCREGGSFIYLV